MKIGREQGGKFPFKIFLRTLALLLVFIGLVYVCRVQLLAGFASFLVIDHAPPQGDIIYLLNGDVNTRPFHAAKLFRAGRAARIVIAREVNDPAVQAGLLPNMTDVAVGIMEKLGVPRERISVLPVPGGVTSTREEAAVLRQYVDAHGTRRVILVTSAFHTRRALWIMRKVLSGSAATILSSPAPHQGFDQASWWKEEHGLIAFAEEYIKLLYYYAKYR